MKFNWIEVWTESLFAIGAILSLGMVLWFNLKTARIVRAIRGVYHEEGRDWAFWSDYDSKLKFVFSPNSLLNADDSAAVSAAKLELINHRREAAKTVVAASLALLLCMILSVAVPIFVGWQAATHHEVAK